MTAVKAGDVDRALASRGPDVNLLLFYGPDAGRATERARNAARAAVQDPDDPFQLIRLDGDAVADAPGRLVEEATTFGMFGGRRAIWVRPTSRSVAPAVAACLEASLVDTLVVIEAGDLSKGAPLRVACEQSPKALALPCYGDEGRALTDVIAETLRAHGLSVAADARALLADSLGGDRLATRGELDKLALYAHGRDTVTLADVEAVVSDVSGASFDAAIDAAFCGDRVGLDAALSSLAAAGTSPVASIAIAIRHALTLLAVVARMGGSGRVESVLPTWRGLHFRRKAAATRQLQIWEEEDVAAALRRLDEAALATRRNGALADEEASQALFAIAARARALAAGRRRA